MIIVKMMGQLGNQLFIYAFARSLQKQYGGKIYFDLSGLKRYYYTAHYMLSEYNLPSDLISYDLSEIGVGTRFKYEVYTRLFHLEQKIIKKLRHDKKTPDSMIRRWFNRGCYFNYNRNKYEYPISDKKVKMVYGYFQAEEYFESVKKELQNELVLRKKLTEQEYKVLKSIETSESVGISIRLHFKNYIEKEYYIEAVKTLLKKNSFYHFFVFADDIETVKNSFIFPVNVDFVEPSSSVTGLCLLSKCKHFIIANSSFSWWGAYLSENSDKTIIMPKPWDKDNNREDIYFKNCIKIPCSFRSRR